MHKLCWDLVLVNYTVKNVVLYTVQSNITEIWRTTEGFLSTEDSNAPGNNALLDLVAALHWVKENIAAFGGDPDQVTLMGQGHGAALVNILMISPVAKGLYRCSSVMIAILPLFLVCGALVTYII